MLKELSCNKLFPGIDSIDMNYGLTTTNDMKAALNKQIIKAAKLVILLADSTKYGRRGFSKICDLTEVDLIITD